MYKAGFINTKVFVYREIYLWVQAQVKARGITKNQAVLEAEVKFEKDERTIWRALNCFTDNVVSPRNKIIFRPLIYANQHNNHQSIVGTDKVVSPSVKRIVPTFV